MRALLPADFLDVRWETWAIAGTGLLCAVLVVVLGQFYSPPARPMSGGRKDDPAPADADAWPGADRRAHPRQPAAGHEILIADAELRTSAAPGLILDRSLGGLGLEVGDELPVGTYLRVRPASGPSEAPWILVEVRYCRRRGDRWRVGCQFLEMSSWDLMNLFGPPDPDEE